MRLQLRASWSQVPPLVAWCLCFCLGIVLGRIVHLPWRLIAAVATGALLLSVVFIKKKTLATILIFILAFLLGVLNLYRAQMIPGCSLAWVLSRGKQAVVLRGRVLSNPVFHGDQGRAFLEVKQIGKENDQCPACGRILVRFRGQPNIWQGDQVLVGGLLYRPYRGFWSNGVDAVMSAKGKDPFVVLPSEGIGLILSFKQKLKDAIRPHVGAEEGKLLAAMLFGERDGVPGHVKDSMIRAGTWHIMVVSGAHTALVAALLLILLKVLRFPRKARFWLCIGLLIGYCLLTGASNPVLRATVMSTLFLSGFLVQRKPHFYNALAAAALFILIFDPTQLFAVGFQLSFCSVFFIVWLAPKVKTLFPESLLKYHSFSFGVVCFCVTFSAWLGTAPLMARVFGSVSWVAVLANMLVVPLAMLVMMAGFCLVFVAIVLPFVAPSIGLATNLLVYALVKINFIFSGMPFAYWKFRPIPLVVVLAIYAAIFFLGSILPQPRQLD
ncbi:MAG: ComEC/Rec2 family competence protein [Candidatus Omnitrophota bacterium]